MTEQHLLRVDPRKNQLTFDGKCSCGKWRVINRPRADIREQHGQHVDEHLGPEGTERTQR